MTDTPTAETGKRVELTVRGLLLGVLITLLFTAANVYAGLKVALTFATSIPAAVISMALLRAFTRNSTIQENNIVQTVASAAGTLASVVFVVPGMVMIGWWSGFPFWQTFAICAIGGVLGVMYTIPLRRALVTTSTLPYPEGVAAAEVLKVGMASREGADEGANGLKVMVVGAITSALVALLVAMKVFAGAIAHYFRPTPTTATGLGGGMSFLLVGVGHLMGVAVGMAMLVGLIITWGVIVPWMGSMHPEHMGLPAEEAANAVWTAAKGNPGARYMGAGAIAAAAIWTLAKLIGPVWKGLMAAIAASSKAGHADGEALPRTEQDMPIWIVGLVSLASLVPMAWLLHIFLQDPNAATIAGIEVPLLVGGLAYIVIAGFAVAAVCGYMAGLIGSSNSPVSGLAILSVLGAALLLVVIAKATAGPGGEKALIAFSLLVTAVLLTVATIANDNLQDLKTGQLVDATPWKQQFALIVGVFAGSLVIPPTLTLLFKAYGFEGVDSVVTSPGSPLNAPQANLISSIAQGVIQGNLPWNLIGIGVLIGVGLVIVDEGLRKTGKFSLPPLGAALAMYLPSDVTVPVIIGSVLGWAYDRFLANDSKPWGKAARQLGVLLASGLVVGESLMAVVIAGVTVAAGDSAPKDGPFTILFGADPTGGNGVIVAAIAFVVVLLGLYGWTNGLAKKTAKG
jgi:putative OPT family oligopeptide transporter